MPTTPSIAPRRSGPSPVRPTSCSNPSGERRRVRCTGEDTEPAVSRALHNSKRTSVRRPKHSWSRERKAKRSRRSGSIGSDTTRISVGIGDQEHFREQLGPELRSSHVRCHLFPWATQSRSTARKGRAGRTPEDSDLVFATG
jgi:hypothetical protein